MYYLFLRFSKGLSLTCSRNVNLFPSGTSLVDPNREMTSIKKAAVDLASASLCDFVIAHKCTVCTSAVSLWDQYSPRTVEMVYL